MLHFRFIKQVALTLSLSISGLCLAQAPSYKVEESYASFKSKNGYNIKDEANFTEDESHIYIATNKPKGLSLTRISKDNPSETVNTQVEFSKSFMLFHSGLHEGTFYIVYYEIEIGKGRKPIELMYREYDFDKKDWLTEPIVYVKPQYLLNYGAILQMSLDYGYPFVRETSANKKHTIYTYGPLDWSKEDKAKVSVALINENKVEWHQTYMLPWSAREGKLFQTLITNDGNVYMIYGVNEEGKGHRDGYQLKTLRLKSDGSFGTINFSLPFNVFNPSIKLAEHPEHGKIIMIQGGASNSTQSQLLYGKFLEDGNIEQLGNIDLRKTTKNASSKSQAITGWNNFEMRFLRDMRLRDFEILDDGQILLDLRSFSVTLGNSAMNQLLSGVGLLKFDVATGEISWANCIPINQTVSKIHLTKYNHLQINNSSHIIVAVSNKLAENEEGGLLKSKTIYKPTSTTLMCYSIGHETGETESHILCDRNGLEVSGAFLTQRSLYHKGQIMINVRSGKGERSILTVPIKL